VLSIRDEDIILDDESPDVAEAVQAGTMKRRGRPSIANKKIPISIRLEADTVEALRNLGPGWQTNLSNMVTSWTKSPEFITKIRSTLNS
jgi:uncharacterized protein (DUF4415 family)